MYTQALAEVERIKGTKVDKRVMTRTKLCTSEYIAEKKRERDEQQKPKTTGNEEFENNGNQELGSQVAKKRKTQGEQRPEPLSMTPGGKGQIMNLGHFKNLV